MNDSKPRYLLRTETGRGGSGRWQFVLRRPDGSVAIEADDVEPHVWGERLDLLTVVRALETLDEPSRVTLIGSTRYVEQGIQFGLPEWKESDWRWECFGQMVPIRDVDLWQRIDRILQIHQVDCCQRRFDAGHSVVSGPHQKLLEVAHARFCGRVAVEWIECHASRFAAYCGAGMKVLSWLWHKASWGRGQVSGVRTHWNTA